MFQPENMTDKQCAAELKRLRTDINRKYDSVARKRSWRESEKAMVRADLAQTYAALGRAIKLLERE